MLVVGTAGHVDHGKTTLVRALTGMETDRLAEERRRGLTIELGYAWTRLTGSVVSEAAAGSAGGAPGRPVDVAFVDVPGHERFIGTTIAGLGPAPAVLLVVAADAGWAAQTTEHLAVISALGVERAVVAVTRSDLADPLPVAAEVGERLRDTPLAGAPVVPVSAVTGTGLVRLRQALHALATPAGPADGPAAVWVDRAFTRAGAGTVVTGTLGTGLVAVGQTVWLTGPSGSVRTVVRTVQALGRERSEVHGPARVALNLRGVPVSRARRGQRLTTTPVEPTDSADVLLSSTALLPRAAQLHVGTTSRAVSVRDLGRGVVRLRWAEPLPLLPRDRGLLRDPARHQVLTGVTVLDPTPPALRRRGDAGRRAAELTGQPVRRVGDLLVEEADWQHGVEVLRTAAAGGPVPVRQVASLTGHSRADVVAALAGEAGLTVAGGELRGRAPGWASAVEALEHIWSGRPFASPTREELDRAGLGARALNEAAAAGRVLRLPGGVVLPPDAATRAVDVLVGLPERFTTSQAREALDTSRRVALALLEHLDATGRTRRVDASHRTVVRGPRHPG